MVELCLAWSEHTDHQCRASPPNKNFLPVKSCIEESGCEKRTTGEMEREIRAVLYVGDSFLVSRVLFLLSQSGNEDTSHFVFKLKTCSPVPFTKVL